MKEILFLLKDKRIRAFGYPVDGLHRPGLLRYEGKEDIPYANDDDIKAFINYMLDSYGNGGLHRTSFLCMEADAVGACVEAAANISHLPPAAFYTFVYLLPAFCRKMDLTSDCTVSFAGKMWHISDGCVETAETHAAPSFLLSEADVGDLFFTPEPPPVKGAGEDKALPYMPPGELGRYVERSKVKRKSSAGERHG